MIIFGCGYFFDTIWHFYARDITKVQLPLHFTSNPCSEGVVTAIALTSGFKVRLLSKATWKKQMCTISLVVNQRWGVQGAVHQKS